MNAKTTLFSAAVLLAGASANAAVLVGGTVNGLFAADGGIPAAPSKTMAIIDVDGDGIAGFDLANWDGSGFLPDADDVIVTDAIGLNGPWYEATGDGDETSLENAAFDGTNALIEVPTDRYQFDLAAVNDATTVGAGDIVYLFWFPELSLDAPAPGGGQAFGVLQLGELDPVGGVNAFLYFGTEDFRASNVTVPEPGALALISLAGLSMLRRRR